MAAVPYLPGGGGGGGLLPPFWLPPGPPLGGVNPLACMQEAMAVRSGPPLASFVTEVAQAVRAASSVLLVVDDDAGLDEVLLSAATAREVLIHRQLTATALASRKGRMDLGGVMLRSFLSSRNRRRRKSESSLERGLPAGTAFAATRSTGAAWTAWTTRAPRPT